MNQINLIGNLTADPEMAATSSDIFCRFSIAVNRSYGGAERKTDFFNCVAWRGLGETVSKYTKKGSKVRVTGSMEMRDYEDSKGIKRTAYDVVCREVEFLTSRSSSEDEVVPF